MNKNLLTRYRFFSKKVPARYSLGLVGVCILLTVSWAGFAQYMAGHEASFLAMSTPKAQTSVSKLPLTMQKKQAAMRALACNGTMYLFQGSETTGMYWINSASNPFTYNWIGARNGIQYNAVGFNPTDGYLYAMRNDGKNNFGHLLRIDENGYATDLGVVRGLPKESYNSGDFDSNGNFYVKQASGSGDDGEVIFRINVSDRSSARIRLSRDIGNTPDLAFNPKTGLLYGVRQSDGRLLSIDPGSGSVSLIGGSSGTDTFGAMMGSSTGNIYGSENGGGFYQFNLQTGARILISSSPANSNNDGAHCVTQPITFSSDLYVTKTDNQDRYRAGNTVTYTIVAGNVGPFGTLGATVKDAVPAGLPAANMRYTAVASSGATTQVQGTRTGAIDDVVGLPVNGTVTYTVTLTIPANFSGNLQNTVNIAPPIDTSDPNWSNNQATDIDRQDIPPIASNDKSAYTSGSNKNINVLANDNTGDAPVPSTVKIINAGASANGKSLYVASQGTWRVETNGTLTFYPDANFKGDPSLVYYTVQDADGITSNSATVTLDASPITTNDKDTYTPGSNKTINVLANDNTGDAIVPSTVKITTAGVSANGKTLVVPNQGTWTVSATGAITFAPLASFKGDPTPITYTGQDDDGNTSNAARVTLDALPVATNDKFPYTVGTTKTEDILANDNTGDAIVPSTVKITTTGASATGKTLVVPNEGTWTIDPTTGATTFTPLASFKGDPTPINYTGQDNDGNTSNVATITFDALPLASDDEDIYTAGSTKTINVLANDNTGDIIVPTTVKITTAGASTTGKTLVVPNQGTWTVDPTTGAITFTPLTGFRGDPTPITYTGQDNDGNTSNAAKVTLKAVDIRLTKTGKFNDANGDGKAQVGETITYSFKVENTGSIAVSDIKVTDPKVAVTGGPISLAPGATDVATFTAIYTLTQADIDGGQVNNLATATGKDPKGDPVSDDSENGNPVDPKYPAPPTCTTCTVTPVPTSPAIRLTKTGKHNDANGDGKAQAGETIAYSFKVENTGNVTVSDIKITDPKVTVNGGPVTLAPGAIDEATFTAVYTLTQADLDAGQVNNLATARGKDPQGNRVTDDSENGNPVDPKYPAPPSCSNCTVTPTPQLPAIRLTKTGTFNDKNGDGKAQVGETISYTFKVENTGNVTVSDIKVTDPKVTVNGGPISLAPGATDAATFTAIYTVTQADIDARQVNNLATATGKDPKGNPVSDDSENGNPVDPKHPAPPTCTTCTVTPVPTSPAIRLTKTGKHNDANGDGKAQAGETIAYSFKVENIGNVTVSDIKITDPKVMVNGGPVTLAPGAIDETTFTAIYTLTQADLDAGQVNNLATARGNDPQGNPVTDDSENGNPVDPKYPAPPSCSTCTVTPLPANPGIRLTKTGKFNDANGDGKAQAGETITYSFKVENTGNVTVSDIRISDPKVTVNGGPISLAPGATDETTFTAVYTLTQADIDAGQVNNLATATGKDPKGNPVSDDSENGNPVDPKHPAPPGCTSCTVTPVPQNGAIALVKKVSNKGTGANGRFLLGNTIEYTFTVTNTGNLTLSNLSISDPILEATPFALPGTLAPGASIDIKKTYVVTSADIAAGKVTNTAVVNATDPKGNPVTDKSGSDTDNDNPTVTVIAKPPVAVDDEASVAQNKPVDIKILDNDLHEDSPLNPATVVVLSNPSHGKVTINPDGTVTYKPDLNYFGPDSFVYTVRDENGQVSNPATVKIEVVPSKPEAINDVGKTQFNTPILIHILKNDKEDGSPLQKNSVEIIDQTVNGKLEVNDDGTVLYTPKAGFTGKDSFTYRVKDENENWANIATGLITVEGFFIPNVFTPNGDGRNDTFFIVGLDAYESVDVEIYNRWENLVYQMKNYKNDWTGNGLNEGTYFYKVVLKKGGKTQTLAGPVLLKR